MGCLGPFIRDMRGPTVLILLCLGCWFGAIHGLSVDLDSALWPHVVSFFLVFFLGSLAMILGRSSAVIWLGAALCGLSAGTGLSASNGRKQSDQEVNAKAWIQFECIGASKRKFGGHEQQVVSPDGVRWLLVSKEPVQLGWSGLALCSVRSWPQFAEPWGFDAARFHQGKGIHRMVLADQVVQWPSQGYMSRLHRMLAEQTRRAKDSLDEGPGSGWLKGLVTGDKSAMSPSEKKAFSAIGLGHLTAVSGFHVGLVSAAFLFILTLVFGARVWNALLVIPGVWLYISACGAPPSAVRAGIMASALAIGHVVIGGSDFAGTLSFRRLGRWRTVEFSCCGRHSLVAPRSKDVECQEQTFQMAGDGGHSLGGHCFYGSCRLACFWAISFGFSAVKLGGLPLVFFVHVGVRNPMCSARALGPRIRPAPVSSGQYFRVRCRVVRRTLPTCSAAHGSWHAAPLRMGVVVFHLLGCGHEVEVQNSLGWICAGLRFAALASWNGNGSQAVGTELR